MDDLLLDHSKPAMIKQVLHTVLYILPILWTNWTNARSNFSYGIQEIMMCRPTYACIIGWPHASVCIVNLLHCQYSSYMYLHSHSRSPLQGRTSSVKWNTSCWGGGQQTQHSTDAIGHSFQWGCSKYPLHFLPSFNCSPISIIHLPWVANLKILHCSSNSSTVHPHHVVNKTVPYVFNTMFIHLPWYLS